MSKKHYIIVKELLAEAGVNTDRTYLGYSGFRVDDGVALEPLRGDKYSAQVTGFYVRVGSRKYGNSITSFWQEKITGPEWKVLLARALNIARQKALEYNAQQDAQQKARVNRQLAVTEYAVQLGEKIGRTVRAHQVVSSDKGPAGIQFTITLNGTVDEVAEKFSRVIAVAEEYRTKSVL